jgi:hypothetical protein
MSIARLLTKSNSDDIFIVDENDRRLICLDRNGNTLFAQDKWNRNLHNVRGIASGNNSRSCQLSMYLSILSPYQ